MTSARSLLRASIVAGILLCPALGTASAEVTIADIVRLKTAGVSDDVVIAVIEHDTVMFRLSPDDIIYLRKQGVSDRVIIAMLATVKRAPQPAPAVPVQPEPTSTQPTEPDPIYDVTEVPTSVPMVDMFDYSVVYPIAYPIFGPRPFFRSDDRRKDDDDRPGGGRDAPVFWGFGGKQRPDSWGLPQTERQGPPRVSSGFGMSVSTSSPSGTTTPSGTTKTSSSDPKSSGPARNPVKK